MFFIGGFGFSLFLIMAVNGINNVGIFRENGVDVQNRVYLDPRNGTNKMTRWIINFKLKEIECITRCINTYDQNLVSKTQLTILKFFKINFILLERIFKF